MASGGRRRQKAVRKRTSSCLSRDWRSPDSNAQALAGYHAPLGATHIGAPMSVREGDVGVLHVQRQQVSIDLERFRDPVHLEHDGRG